MKKNEKISFVIPMYNAEKYIEECINSIINQDYPNKNNSSKRKFQILLRENYLITNYFLSRMFIVVH